MRRMIKNRGNLKSRRITAAAVAALSAAAVVITSVLSGAIEVEAADTLLGIEKLRSRYMESGREFVILEIAPDRKAAEIGYLVDGYEPLLCEWDEEEQVWKSWRDTLCELPKTKRKAFIEEKKEELRAYYKKNGLAEEFPVEAVEAEYEEGEPKQDGFEKIVSDGSKSTGWFQKLGGTPAEGTDRYQIAFRFEGLYNNSYVFDESVLYYNVLSATKIDENLVGGIEDDRPIYTKEDDGVYQYCGTWGEVNGAVRTALEEEDDLEEPDDDDEEEPKPDDGESGGDNGDGDDGESGDGNGGSGDGESGGDNGGSGEGESGDGNGGSGEGESGDGNGGGSGEGESGGENGGSGEGESGGENGGSGEGESGGENGGSGEGESGGENSSGSGDVENAGDGGTVAAGAVSASESVRKDKWVKLVADGDPAQGSNAGAGDNADKGKPEEPKPSGDSEKPKEPKEPENPTNPENPEKPENPTNPENPEKPENPKEPENPEKPEEPTNPENPEDPEEPENPDDPKDPEEDEPAADDPIEEEEIETNVFAQGIREYYLVAFQKVDDNTEPAVNTPMYSVRSKDDIVLSENGEYEFIEWDGKDANQGRQEYTFAGKEIWCRNTFKSNEWFKKYVLNMDKKDYGKFRIKVLTFTPQELGAMEQIPNFHFLYLNSGLKDKESVSDNSTVSENNGDGGGSGNGDGSNTGNGDEGKNTPDDSVKAGLFAADSLPGKWRKLVADGAAKDNGGGTTGGTEDTSGGNAGGGTEDTSGGNAGGGTGDNGGGTTGGGTGDNGSGTTGGGTEDTSGGNAGGGTGDNGGGTTGGGTGDNDGGNAGGGTGDNDGGTTGGTEDTSGGNAGGGTGDNDGGNTGGTGDNDGGNTGGIGDNDGGSTGGTGDNDGGNTGGTGDNDGGNTGGTEDKGGSGDSSVSENNGAAEKDSVSENNSGFYRKRNRASDSVSNNDIGSTGASAYGADNDLSAELLKYFVEKTVAGAVPCLIDGSILYAKDENGSIAINEKLKNTNIFRLSAMLCQDDLSEWYESHRNNYGRLTTEQLINGIVEDADKNFVEEHVYCRFGNGSDSIINDRFAEATIYKEGGEIEPGFQCVLDEIRLENLYRESDSSGNYKPLSTKISQAKAVRHILNYADRRKVKAKKEIKVLEIQPAMADEPELTLDQIKTWAPDVEKADITVMTTAEFIGKIEKLNETYDLIYIGTSKDHLNMRYWTDSGYIGKPTKDHVAAGTAFNDSDMDGLIYYNIGDLRGGSLGLSGMLDSDYWNGNRSDYPYFYTLVRYGGNDITEEKMEALVSFLDGSYPIVIADDFLEQPATVFAEKEHKGARVNLAEGEYTQARLAELGVKEADISSIKVKEGYRVTLFDRDNFKYYSLSFDSKDEETYDLSKCKYGNNGNTWDNKTVSLIVERKEDATPERKIDGDHIDNCTYLYEFVQKAMKEKYLNFYAWGDIAENSELFKFYLNRPKVSLEDKAANGEVKEGSDIHYIESDINGRYELQYKFRIRNEGVASYDTRYNCKLYIDVNSDGKFSESEEIEDIVLTQGGSQVSADNLYADREYILSRAVPMGYKGLLPWRVEITQADNEHIYTSMSGFTKLEGMEQEQLKILQIARNPGWNGEPEFDLGKEINTPGTIYNKLVYGGEIDGVTYEGIAKEFAIDVKYNTISMYEEELRKNPGYLKDFNMLILGFNDMYGNFSGNDKTGAMGAIVDFINSGKSVLFSHDTTAFINYPQDRQAGYPWRDNHNDRRGNSEEAYNEGLTRYARGLVGMDRYGVLSSDAVRKGAAYSEGSGGFEEIVSTRYDKAYEPKSNKKKILPQVHGYTYMIINGKDRNAERKEYNKKSFNKWELDMSKPYEWTFENNYRNIRFDKVYYKGGHIDDSVEHYGEVSAGGGGGGDMINTWGEIDKLYVTQVNRGQIVEYPYKLDETFEIAETHGQYYELDYTADDDGDGQSDLVVWYCLGKRANGQETVYSQSPNDVRNNYYIYNKGNITYTGMGHSVQRWPMYTVNEAKLFINTMIASYQAGIRDPQVKVLKSGVPEADEMKLLYRYYDQGNRFSLNDEATPEGYEKIYFTVQDTNLIKGTRQITSQVYYKDDGGSLEIDADEVPGADGQMVKQKVRVSPVPGSICSAKDDSVVASDNLVSGGVYYIQVPKDIMRKSEDGLDLYFEAQTTLTTNTAKQNVYTTEKAYAKLRVLQAYLFDLE